MTSRKAKQTHARRDRRLAKASGYKRSPKSPKRKGHGSSLTQGVVVEIKYRGRATVAAGAPARPTRDRFPEPLTTSLGDLLTSQESEDPEETPS